MSNTAKKKMRTEKEIKERISFLVKSRNDMIHLGEREVASYKDLQIKQLRWVLGED